jgi:Trypsin-like peptidase domain
VKKLATVLLALIFLLPLAAKGSVIQPPKGFDGDVFKATMLLEGIYKDHVKDFCTVTAYETIPGGYHLIGAGHCVGKSTGYTYAVADDVNEEFSPVTVVKSAFDKKFDFSVFELKTDKVYPVIPLGTLDGVSIGDDVIDVNFALASAKQLSVGKVSSANLTSEGVVVPGYFMAQIFGSEGSSGSALISSTTHKIVGIVTMQFGDDNEAQITVGVGVESIDNFQMFLRAPVVDLVKLPVSISDIDFQQLFGKEHPFKLKVHGPNPTFVQAGYKFQVQALGFELSDIYYKKPVHIEKMDDIYRLITNKGFGVDLTFLGKA